MVVVPPNRGSVARPNEPTNLDGWNPTGTAPTVYHECRGRSAGSASVSEVGTNGTTLNYDTTTGLSTTGFGTYAFANSDNTISFDAEI